MPETLQGDRVREGSETIWSAPILGVKSGEGDPALGEKMGCKIHLVVRETCFMYVAIIVAAEGRELRDRGRTRGRCPNGCALTNGTPKRRIQAPV